MVQVELIKTRKVRQDLYGGIAKACSTTSLLRQCVKIVLKSEGATSFETPSLIYLQRNIKI